MSEKTLFDPQPPAPTATVEISPPPVIETAPATTMVAPGVQGLEGVTARSVAEEVELSRELMRAESSLIDRIWTMDNAAELMERRAMLIEQTHISAVRATNPADWILSRDKQNVTTAMLRASGSTTVGTYYGIRFTEFYVMGNAGKLEPVGTAGFEPSETRDEESDPVEVEFSVWFDAESFVTGRKVRSVKFSRSSSEDFIGRGVQDATSKLVARADLSKSCMTGAYTKACRILGNMTRLDASFLEKCWENTGKTLAGCSRGSGFGSAGARGAARLTDADVGTLQAELRDSLLALCDNDKKAAQTLLADITEYNGRHCENVEQITNPGRFFHTWKRLGAHSGFGKSAEEWVLKQLGERASKQAKDGIEAGVKERGK